MLVTLAEIKAVVNTSELGKKMLVSPKYLRKLAGPLEKEGLIRSIQGVYGGYILNREPEQIRVADIFTAFEERINITGCISKKDCPISNDCLTKPVWSHLESVIEKEFYRISLQNILDKNFTQPATLPL